jgi:predicted glycosyltransferase
MTREAALLGVPTLSAFAGRRPAVDRWLEAKGLLHRLVSIEQVRSVTRRAREPCSPAELRADAQPTIELFVEATVASS